MTVPTTAPLHISISEKLRQQIESGEYSPGEKLPSEHQLMAIFDVSRITIRQAIANLVGQGLVQSQQGKGVFVTPKHKVSYSLSSPLVFLEQDLAEKGVTLSIENLSLKKIYPSPKILASLNLAKRKKVLFQEKLLKMDGAAGALDITYLLSSVGDAFADDLASRMTFPLLEEHDIHISKIDATIECTHADYKKSHCLDVPLGHPLIVYRYTAYTEQQPILHGETISRADRFCYSLTIQAS